MTERTRRSLRERLTDRPQPSPPSAGPGESTGAPSTAPEAGSTPAPAPAGQAAELLRLVNAFRTENGVPPLAPDPILTKAAAWYAEDMAGKDRWADDHSDSLGRSARQRVLAFGYPESAATGENILFGAKDAAAAFAMWRDSPPHRDNLLSPRYTAVGLAGSAETTWDAPGDVFAVFVADFGSVLTAEQPAPAPTPTPAPSPKPAPKPKPSPSPKEGGAGGVLGAPSGTIPTDLQIAYGRGGDWALVNQDDPFFVRYGEKYGVPPQFLKAMMVVETGGRMIPNQGGSGAAGTMQIKTAIWGAKARELGYDLTTREGQVAMAAYILSLEGPGNHERAFLASYYPTPGLDVPGEDGHTPRQYLADLTRLVRIIDAAAGGTSTTAPPDPWRPYPYPTMVDLLVEKPYEGAGFDRVPFRRPNVRGFCTHITDGPTSQPIEFFQGFFGTGGARAYDALTDLVIGYDGRIGLLNDWRDPARGGTRAGWANGGVDGLEGDGVAFYRLFPAINEVLVSCEHTARTGDRWSDAMLAATIEVRTAIAQELKCPASSYPYHPGYGGVSIEQQHRNFATKSCPAEPYISTHAPVVLGAVKRKLAAWQGDAGADGPPVTPPVTPEWVGPLGLPIRFFVNGFGTLRRYDEGGAEIGTYGFDPKGPISLAWLARGAAEKVWPKAEDWRTWDSTLAPGKEHWVGFANGWRLVLPIDNGRAGWRWLDRMEETTVVESK